MGENTSLFKVFRVLWFPVSVNAMALGAAAVVLFWAGSWLGCLLIGAPSLADTATHKFPDACQILVLEKTWPGYATATEGEGDDSRHRHHLVVPDGDEEISAEERAAANQDEAVLQSLFGGWYQDQRAEIDAKDLSDEERKEARKDLQVTVTENVPRYRLVLGGQLLWFFCLWSTFGVAICRILVLRIARDEYCTLGSAFAFAWRVKLTGMLYPLAVLLPILFLLLCNHFAGMLTWIPWVGWLIGIILLPLTIISSLLAVLIGIAGLVSLGFVPAAIATERKGTYDSLGKAFNYIFARAIPLMLQLVVFFYFLGLVHELLVEQQIVEEVLADSMMPLWEGPNSDFQGMVTGQDLDGPQGYFALAYGAVIGIYRLLLWGGLISFTLGAFTSLFLILRKDVDGVDYIDVARDPSDAEDVPAPEAPPPANDGASEDGPGPAS